MAKYRLLTIEELRELEKEFVEYLILNGITADDWTKIKSDNHDKASRIIHLFSDVVFEKIMRKTQFLEWRGANELKALQCLKDKFVVVGLNASKIPASPAGGHKANLNDPDYLNEAMLNPPSNLEIYTSEFPYDSSREEEIFRLTENGFQISDGKLFKTLCLALPQ
ncbi:MAG: hypothetical protein KAI99_01775 [Cyclobacteriaceae bacterium]|nr:hypothetical protein [Cyclobacteriaceae bacterium]